MDDGHDPWLMAFRLKTVKFNIVIFEETERIHLFVFLPPIVGKPIFVKQTSKETANLTDLTSTMLSYLVIFY